jgi:hypothetical protein
MKKFIIPILFLFPSVLIVAQTTTDDYYNNQKTKFISKDKVHASVSIGAGVSFLGTTKNTTYTTFVAPKIGYQLTNKFRLNVGLMHYTMTGNTFMPLNQNESLLNNNSKSVSGNLLFVEGQYLLNKRLTLSGAVLYGTNNLSVTSRQNNYKAASIGLDYKVTEHSSIGIRATLSEGSNNYYMNSRTGKFDYNPYSPGSLMQNTMFETGKWGANELNSLTR